MAAKCANCSKGIMIGHNVSHAKNRTRKIFKPNLHNSRVMINGISMKVKLCTKCLRVIKNTGKKVEEVTIESTEAPVVATA